MKRVFWFALLVLAGVIIYNVGKPKSELVADPNLNVPTGNFVANYTGADTCPDPETYDAFMSAELRDTEAYLAAAAQGYSRTKEEARAEEETELKANGCTPVPIGTPLVSEGGISDSDGLHLAIVTAHMANGSTVKGVTMAQNLYSIPKGNVEVAPEPTAVNQPMAAEKSSPSVLPVVAPETQQTEPVQQEAEPQQQTEPIQQDAPPRMGRDGITGGQASEKWQKVQSGGQEIYVKTNSFLVHEGLLYIEGDCDMRQYFFSGSMETPQTPQRIRLIPGSPFEKTFDMLCKIAREQK